MPDIFFPRRHLPNYPEGVNIFYGDLLLWEFRFTSIEAYIHLEKIEVKHKKNIEVRRNHLEKY